MLKGCQYFIVILFAVACNNVLQKNIERYDSGSIAKEYYIDQDSLKQGLFKVYHPSGKIAFEVVYKNDKYADTAIYYRNDSKNTIQNKRFFYDDGSNYYIGYSKNGIKKQEGILNSKDQRIGKWLNYNESGSIDFIKEYKIINGSEYTNQLWMMLSTKDTLSTGANIIYSYDKGKFNLSDSICLFFQTNVSAFPDSANTEVSVVLPDDYTKHNFSKDFSNSSDMVNVEKKVSVIEIKSLQKQKRIQFCSKAIDSSDFSKTVVFFWKPKRTGNDTIRGYFKEQHSFYEAKNPLNKNTIQTQLDRKTYFELPIQVKE